MIINNLKSKSLKAVIWSFIESFGVYLVRFGFTIAIARKLSPRDYGLSGMIAIFLVLSMNITEGGFSWALIQKKNADQKDYSTVFFFNLFVAILLYFAIFFSAEQIAKFYNEPILVKLSRVASLGIVFNSLITVQLTILNKKLEFKIPAIVRMISALISGVIGVLMAYNGFGVWSLIYPGLIASIFTVLAIWFKSSWRPSLIFSFISFKSLYRYGMNIFAQNITSAILDQIYYPIIGKMYSATELGFYNNAKKFYQIFVRRITIAYGKVAFPAFSSIQDNPVLFKQSYQKTMLALAFLLIPFNSLLVVSAKSTVLILLTEKWAKSIPLLQLLYIDGFFFPFLLLNLNVLNALGKSKLSLLIDSIKKVFVIIGVFIAVRYGIQALIISQIISTFIGLIISIYFVNKHFVIRNNLKDIGVILMTSAVFVLLSLGVRFFIVSNILTILIQFVLFVFLFYMHKKLRTNGYLYFFSFIKPIIPQKILRYF